MKAVVWLDRLIVETIHVDQVRIHGGLSGVRDENALESALARPLNRAADDTRCGLADLAAAYGFGLATSHPFNDGNKRVALAAALVFLWLNGCRIETDDDSLTGLLVGVASGAVAKSEIAVYLQRHAERRA